jgi:hypothetical protein
VEVVTVDNGADGRDKAYCGGRKRDGSGGTCTRPAGWGTRTPGVGRCKLHGGATASHRAAAEKEIARQAVATFGLPLEVEPHRALLGEVWRTSGAVAWLDGVVRGLDAEQVTWGVTEESDKAGTVRKAGINVWVDLWQRERRHLVDVCKAALAAGVEERLVRLAESHGSQLAAVIRVTLTGLDLTAEQQARVPAALAAAVASVTGAVEVAS